MYSQVPIFQDVARFFAFPVQKQSASNSIVIGTAFGTDYGNVSLMPGQYFVLTNFRCFTNYDAFGGAFSTAGVTTPVGISSPFTPNNFNVQITRGQNSLFSNTPLSQAQICNSGYHAGKAFPFPTIYGERENFTFQFTDTTGLIATNQTSLVIKMFMEGYVVPIPLFDKFLNIFPAARAVYGN